ncbi:MAG: DMT family transporter [Betaproteobacteria bacterium]|nr:DMT family transporter [Betaproteobacteria bacterium]
MKWIRALQQTGVSAALAAALLFGAGTPLAKLLLKDVGPWLLAGLLYLGSGIGLLLYRRLRRAPRVHLAQGEAPWMAGAILAGGVLAPVLLMLGLAAMPASDASLLLNAEGVFTALLAWFVFKENVDARIALGMAAIVAGALVLSWPSETHFAGLAPTLAVMGACLAWAVDNNLTRKLSLTDATWIAAIKGLTAGTVNLMLAFALGASLPSAPNLAVAMAVGFLAYGVSLALFVVGLRHLGTARTGAYFSVAPFFGAAVAIVLGEAVTLPLLIAAALMAFGIWLHLSEHHQHVHEHPALKHAHMHVHDVHHQHDHDFVWNGAEPHAHPHAHAPLRHEHPHFPDSHHGHRH